MRRHSHTRTNATRNPTQRPPHNPLRLWRARSASPSRHNIFFSPHPHLLILRWVTKTLHPPAAAPASHILEADVAPPVKRLPSPALEGFPNFTIRGRHIPNFIIERSCMKWAQVLTEHNSFSKSTFLINM